jgi:hypothetical protein
MMPLCQCFARRVNLYFDFHEQAATSIEGLSAEALMTGPAQDRDHLPKIAVQQEALAFIPDSGSRALRCRLAKRLQR